MNCGDSASASWALWKFYYDRRVHVTVGVISAWMKDPRKWNLPAKLCIVRGVARHIYIDMGPNDSLPESMTHHQTKKKRVEDQPLPSDAGQRPIQLQRRRVWRACESCRSVSPPSTFFTSILIAYIFSSSPAGRRSSAMETNQLVLNALLQDPNVHGCRQRTEQR